MRLYVIMTFFAAVVCLSASDDEDAPKPAVVAWNVSKSGSQDFYGSVTTYSDLILATTQEPFAYVGLSLNPGNGSRVWTFNTNQNPNDVRWNFCSPNRRSGRPHQLGFFSACTDMNYAGEVYAVRLTDGVALWSFPQAMVWSTDVSVSCANDAAVVFLNIRNMIFAVNGTTGALLWTRYVNSTNPSYFETVAAPDGEDRVVFSDVDGLHIADVTTGKDRMALPSWYGTPSIMGSVMIFTFSSNLTAIDADGTVVWQRPNVISFGVFGTTVFASGIGGSTMLAYDTSTGSLKWSWADYTQVVGSSVLIILGVSTKACVLCGGLYEGLGNCVAATINSGTLLWLQPSSQFNTGVLHVTDNYLALAITVSETAATTVFVKINDGSKRALNSRYSWSSFRESASLLVGLSAGVIVAIEKW